LHIVKKVYLCIKQNRYIMKATLKFQTSEQAKTFASSWSRATSGGHTLGDTDVTVYNIDEQGKRFIETYVSKLNK